MAPTKLTTKTARSSTEVATNPVAIAEHVALLTAQLGAAKAQLHAVHGKTSKSYPVSEIFGIANSKMTLLGGAVEPMFAVPELPNYVFRPSLVRDMLVFWNLGRRACMLTGEKGSGKTSIVEQFHHRLKINLRILTGNSKMTLEALFGQYIPSPDGGLVWVDGPVTDAARNGYSVVINEFNALDPGLQLALNDVAHEGSAFCVQDRGEQFMPADGFRLFCTINPKGMNDHLYHGRKEIDGSTKERFFWITVDYGTQEEELEIVSRAWEVAANSIDETTKEFCKQIVKVGRIVRERSMHTGPTSIPEILSTRVLCMWAVLWVNYYKKSGAPHYALQRAYTSSCRPEVAKAIHQIVFDITRSIAPATSTIPD